MGRDESPSRSSLPATEQHIYCGDAAWQDFIEMYFALALDCPWPVMNALGDSILTQPCAFPFCTLPGYNYIATAGKFACAGHVQLCDGCHQKIIDYNRIGKSIICRQCTSPCSRCGTPLYAAITGMYRRRRGGRPYCRQCHGLREFGFVKSYKSTSIWWSECSHKKQTPQTTNNIYGVFATNPR